MLHQMEVAKAAEQAKQQLTEDNVTLSIDPTKDIVVSCSGGLASSSLYFGLKDITEGKLAMYDGSYSEYSSA